MVHFSLCSCSQFDSTWSSQKNYLYACLTHFALLQNMYPPTLPCWKNVHQTVYFNWHQNLIRGIAASALQLAMDHGGGGVRTSLATVSYIYLLGTYISLYLPSCVQHPETICPHTFSPFFPTTYYTMSKGQTLSYSPIWTYIQATILIFPCFCQTRGWEWGITLCQPSSPTSIRGGGLGWGLMLAV